MYSKDTLERIVSEFDVDGGPFEVHALGPGFINDTFLVKYGDEPRYILQRKNHMIFPDVPGMMQNILQITEHIKKKVADPLRETLTVVRRRADSVSEEEKAMPAADLYYKDGENYWTMTLFISGSVTYEKADTLELARKGGKGIGRFQAYLADFTTPLNETIKGFHNIRWRFQQWDTALADDAAGRVGDLTEEISWIESRREKMLDFWTMVEDGRLPLRVTHNDTKISNILFDGDGEVLCAIDLDTCMSSTSLNDFGDAIRAFANTGDEDDRNLDNVGLSLDMFRAYTEGYLSERKASMTETELEFLAFGALYITFEQVLRFLMDYIDGDKYYKTAYDGHNLVRARAQYKLLQSMEAQYGKMCEIVKSI